MYGGSAGAGGGDGGGGVDGPSLQQPVQSQPSSALWPHVLYSKKVPQVCDLHGASHKGGAGGGERAACLTAAVAWAAVGPTILYLTRSGPR